MSDRCKICDSTSLVIFKHTARCRECGVLLYYPYLKDRALLDIAGKKTADYVLAWYSKTSFYNHDNFTEMLRFTVDESFKGRSLDVLDYGGGGGQFAMVFKSHFPESTVYITDINDTSLLATWSPVQRKIPFMDFDEDETKFDVIFLNDVFEHVNDPLGILKQLAQKLKDGGKIFIDTPKQFWIYPVTKAISKSLYQKVLKGSVSEAHLQIWTKKSLQLVVEKSGCSIDKYGEISEYTMPLEYYLQNMGIRNPFIKAIGHLFYRNASWLAKNKIICVLSKRGTVLSEQR